MVHDTKVSSSLIFDLKPTKNDMIVVQKVVRENLEPTWNIDYHPHRPKPNTTAGPAFQVQNRNRSPKLCANLNFVLVTLLAPCVGSLYTTLYVRWDKRVARFKSSYLEETAHFIVTAHCPLLLKAA